MLAGSAFGVLGLGLALLAAVGLWLLTVKKLLPWAIGRLSRRRDGNATQQWSWASSHVALAAVAAVALVVLHVAVRANAHRAGDCVKEGKSLRYITVLGMPLLNVRAQEARIEWLGGSESPPPRFGPHVLFLGENEGTAVVYDVAAGAPVRFSAADAVIRLVAVDEGCHGMPASVRK